MLDATDKVARCSIKGEMMDIRLLLFSGSMWLLPLAFGVILLLLLIYDVFFCKGSYAQATRMFTFAVECLT
jgi:hypothetical protein